MKKMNAFYGAGLRLCLMMCFLVLPARNLLAQQLPIRPTRTIAFTTNEGSYMSVDISPDGKTLAFDLLGDLYTMPTAGGIATQLTRGIALNLHPVWSPDGKKLAFVTDRTGEFHLATLNLLDRTVSVLGTKDKDLLGFPSAYFTLPINWTADSHYVAIGDSLYSMTGAKPIMAKPFRHLIGFSKTGDIYLANGKNLMFYDGKSNEPDKLATSHTRFDPLLTVVSPDGQSVAFIADSNKRRCLIIQDIRTSKSKILIPALIEVDERYKNDNIVPHFSFSPDSRFIYISYNGKIHRIEIVTGTNKVVPFSANVKADLGPLNCSKHKVDRSPVKVIFTRSANASPDNKHLVFSALGKVWIMDLPNGKPRPLADQPFNQFQPVFSPDSKWVAYVSWCDTIGGQLWKVSTDGGKPIQLTTAPFQYRHPSWSPDGKSIAVIKGGPWKYTDFKSSKNYTNGNGLPALSPQKDEGMGQLQLVATDGSKIKAVQDSVPFLNNINFSVDGRRLTFTPKRPTQKPVILPMLVTKNIDSGKVCGIIGEVTTQRNISAEDIFYSQKTLSPDGRYFVYSNLEALYLVPIPKRIGLISVPQWDNMDSPNPAIFPPRSDEDMQRPSVVVRFAEGEDPYWEKGGKLLAWSHGNQFYRIDPDKILAAAEKAYRQNRSIPQHRFTSVNITPDETITINLTAPYAYGRGLIALTHARIITMQNNKVIEDGTVVIKEGRFTSVGNSASIKIPKNAKVVDVRGKTIIPGLIDVHMHLRLADEIYPQQSWMLLASLAYGVTTARDPAQSFDAFGYAELLRSGQMLGPRLYSVGYSVDESLIKRAAYFEDLASIVKNRALFSGSEIKQYQLTTRLQRQWLEMACRAQGLNMTNEGFWDPVRQIAMIKDGSTGIEHNPTFGDVYKDVTTLYAKSGSYLTPTLQVCYGTEEAKAYFDEKYWHNPDEKLKRFMLSNPGQETSAPTGSSPETLETITLMKSEDTIRPGFLAPAHIDTRILNAGGKITLGSHGNDIGIGSHNEIWALQMGGFTNMQALRAATLSGAEALGIQQDLGSIEVGKIADLVVLNSNPLNDIHNTRDIKYVMKEGILYDGDTLDELWPIKKKCPVWKTPKVLGNGIINTASNAKSHGVYEPKDDDDSH